MDGSEVFARWRQCAPPLIHASLPHPSLQPRRHLDRFSHYWATVCKNGLPCAIGPLSCPVLTCLFVTLVYCGQTVGWIKMPLDMEVGQGPVDVILDGDSAPPRKGAQQPPTFRPTLLWHGRPSQQLQSVVAQDCDIQTDRQTDRPRYSVAISNN